MEEIGRVGRPATRRVWTPPALMHSTSEHERPLTASCGPRKRQSET